MKPVFLNWRGETVDEFTPGQDAPTGRDFRHYVAEMVANYHLAGMAVYRSSRPCKGWRA